MGEARRRLAAVAVIAVWSGLVASVVVIEVARSRDYLCETEDGYTSCPDGLAYLLPHLVIAGAVTTTVLLVGVLLVSRGLPQPQRLGVAADLAVLAVLPVAGLGGLLALAALGRSPAAALLGLALLAPLALVVGARRTRRRLQVAVWVLLAVGGVAAVAWVELFAVLTVPGAAVLAVGAALAHQSHQSQD